MRYALVYKRLVSYMLSIFSVLIITPIFIETFGPLLLENGFGWFKDESKCIFFVSTLCGQISFPIFSSIDSGFLVIPMFELFESSKLISQSYTNPEDALTNTLLCLSLASLLTFFICLSIYLFKMGSILSKIPLNVIDSLMVATAVFNIYVGFKRLLVENKTELSIALCFVSFAITVIAMAILKSTKNPRFLILYLIALIVLMNLSKVFYDPKFLVENGLFITDEGTPLNCSSFMHSATKGTIDLKKLVYNLAQVTTVGISPIISFSTTLPYYSKHFNLDVDYDKELRSFGLASLFSSILRFPIHISCTGSVLFRICGADKKLHSILAGVSLLFLFIIYQYVTPLLPTFAISLLSQFIGFSIMLGYLQLFPTLTTIDKIVLAFLSFIAVVSSMNALIVLILGTITNLAISYYFSRKVGSEASVVLQEVENTMVVKVQGPLTHVNIQSVSEKLQHCKNNIVFDLLDTKYVDYTANIELENITKCAKQKNLNVQILGRPCNLNKRVLFIKK
ncbi:uncharacterized protein VICG_01241 [Vittaforma corneae ATCC 50505]|uniref:STAS domain-containing protein n=1 Tax=Vittaforma corneae (strain ATCC 50505) TaxID=993615 RepID=L2GN54_VITCO|nr:uncharacterized protein VICG_01241 [Vittaforma corneae ATCC 50505]ELA41737.1 hypothetical protein VICG_01241 [Vittaforma corneae ATCC 50505]